MAQTQQQQHQAVEPQSFTDIPLVQGGSLVTAVLSIGAGIMWFRRRLSNDRLDAEKNRVEHSLLEVLTKERTEAMADARAAWEQRASDAKLIGKLTAEVEGLHKLNEKINAEVELLRVLNEKQGAEIRSLRREFDDVLRQLKNCAICPLRKEAA